MTIDPRLHRIVAEQPYPLLFATISGAHLYGFPSPDSDFDLRGAHVLPIEKVVGLDAIDETVEQEMIVPPDTSSALRPPSPQSGEGAAALEMDIVSHDVRKFFSLLLKKNGYVLEQLFSPLIVHTTPEHEELKEICRYQQRRSGSAAVAAAGSSTVSVRASETGGGTPPEPAGADACATFASGVITKHHAHHYLGFAETQWKLFLKESPRRVKPLLYVYRVLLTGIHLMRTGQVEANLVTLNEGFRLPYIADLVARKLAGPEQSRLEDADLAVHETEYQRLRAELQSAHEASVLPEMPSEETRAALNDLLVRVRLRAVA